MFHSVKIRPMKAALRRFYCMPDKILVEEIEKPTPKDTEVLVEVKASTVNRTDCANLTAKPFIMRFVLGFRKPRKAVLGTDFAGKIVAKGSSVNEFQVGDDVFGFADAGAQSHAEYLAINTKHLFKIPEEINYDIAAASLEGAHYAFSFIHKTKIKPGDKVLINGATGGIGSALLQFVNQFDVKITATSDEKHIDLIRSLGADKVYDYTKESFLNDKDKYDFIFDTVGKSTFGQCKPLLTKKGCYISSELGPYAQNLFLPLVTKFTKKTVIFPVPLSKSLSVPFIIKSLKNGSFKPIIDRRFTLDEIQDAFSYVIEGKKTGNVILEINHEI